MKPILPHPDHHELHGITVAVDTDGPELFVGRCHDVDAQHVYLVDVAVHAVVDRGPTKREWLQQVARFGPFPQHARLTLPRSRVTWMQKLGDIAEHGPPDECR